MLYVMIPIAVTFFFTEWSLFLLENQEASEWKSTDSSKTLGWNYPGWAR